MSTNDEIFLLTSDGEKEVTELAAGYMYQPRGVAVRLDKNERPLLAVAGELPYRRKNERFGGALFVFDANRNLVYHEVFPEPVEALGVMPAPDGKRENLLVGGVNKLWQYSMPPANASHSVQPPH